MYLLLLVLESYKIVRLNENLNLNITCNHQTVGNKIENEAFRVRNRVLLKPLFVLFRYLNWLLRYEDSKLMLNIEDYGWVYDL